MVFGLNIRAPAQQQLLLLLLLSCTTKAQQQTYCNFIEPPIPPCTDVSPRDLVFLVDDPEWWFINNEVGFNPAEYNARVVAEQSGKLKNSTGGVRVFLVGVPNIEGNPPDINFFQGTGRYAQTPTLLTVRRDLKEWSFLYRKPPNPIVSSPISSNSFSSNTFNVQALVTQTVGALCEVTQTPTLQPTLEPTREPTSLAPTSFPTAAPTQPFLDQVDVTFLIDRSNSMNFQAPFCTTVIASLAKIFPNAKTAPSRAPCWELFMRYVLEQSDKIAAIRTAGPDQNRRLGWADDFNTPGHGLRVNVIGFACTNKQKTPKMFDYSDNFTGGVPITNRAQLFNLLDRLRANVLPFGGTCPYLAIEQSVKYVERTSFDVYPYQSVILVTDGVFYDMPAPSRAVTGLRAYEVVRFTVGIAVANSVRRYGMTPEEIATQAEQLRAFVAPDQKGNFKNLGQEGWALLLSVAHNISTEMPNFAGPTKPIPRFTWCGWRKIFNCGSDDFRQQHCVWPDPALVQQYGCRRRRLL